MLSELIGRYRSHVAYPWIGLLFALIVSYVVARAVAAIVIGVGRRLAKRTVTKWDDEIIEAARRPLRMVVAVATLR
ncbi:MAG: hypothetical protein ABI175_06420, partial [Polyangiales bacterium]